MVRYTEKDAKECFEELAKALGKEYGDACYIEKDGKKVTKIGCWKLDCNPVYGGCVVQEFVNEGGAVSMPLGYRRTPREFCDCVEFTLNVIKILKEQKGD